MVLLAWLAMASLPAASAGEIDLSAVRNRGLVHGAVADAACMRSATEPGLPLSFDLAVGRVAENVALTLVARGPDEAAGPALRVTLVYADGVEVPLRLRWGEDLLPRPVFMRQSAPVAVGTDAAGSPVLGTVWTAPTGRPDVVLQRVRVDAPAPTHTLCVVDARTDGPVVTPTERTDTTGWYPFVPAWNLAGALPAALPVEAPAGARGFVRQGDDGHLAWPDGSRARFWGVNIVGAPAFPPREDADAYARTLARLGFNLVRLHHIDQEAPHGVVNPRRGTPGQPEMDPEQLDRLDYFVSRLRAHGLHLYLEVATYRAFTPADGIPDWQPGLPNGHKLAPMFLPAWSARYERWFEDFWGRTNPHTGLRYADDPFVVTVELGNEHSMLANWGFGIETLPPPYQAELDRRWNAWLAARYPDETALVRAWVGSPTPGLAPGESLPGGTIAREPAFAGTFGRWPTARAADLYAFYAELEETWYRRLEAKARAMGFRVPIVPSISYDVPQIQILRDAWRYSDTHLEFDYPRDGRFEGHSALATPERVLGVLRSGGDGHAVTMSELGHPAPNPYRAEAPLLWATLASVQDWDMVIWFSWADSAFTRDVRALAHWGELRTAPVLLAQMPAASAAFRGGWIPRAEGFLPVHFPPDVARLRAGGANLLRRPATFQPWGLLEAATALSQRVRTSFAPTPPAIVAGRPVEGAGWWADPGVLFLDRPALQVRVGPPEAPSGGGAGIRGLRGLEVALEGWAAVSLVATDGRPLGTAASALLTVATTSETTDFLYAAHRTAIASYGRGPVRVQPARGTVRFAWPRVPTLEALGEDGAAIGPVAAHPVAGRPGWWSVDTSAVRSPWITVR